MYRILVVLFSIISVSVNPLTAQQHYQAAKGSISFLSDAPQEQIRAVSTDLKGLLDIEANKFAFTVEMKTFAGFNSDLQQEHFNETYMESDQFQKAIFIGKLIDKFNPNITQQKIRAKGQLEIHGIKKERIIDIVITKNSDGYNVTSAFNVLLADHGIVVPKIVFQKIAETINVKVDCELAHK